MSGRAIRKLLIANRGEIAIRVILAAKEMGIRTVAVYSDADDRSRHIELADEKLRIGPGEPALSYLDIDKLIAAAKDTGCDAVHPGYGFLSERAEFAEACRTNGLSFVGPSPEAMKLLGSKIEAKTLAVSLEVPIVPGFFSPGASFEDLAAAADRIGFPVLLKASAGGGGRGMRAVHSREEFENEFRIATSEAEKAFGDGAMMVEKLIERPRHIEVQVLADTHGTVVCLFERECSIQRRHQKLIEEAPSPLAGYERLWPSMREAAIRLIQGAHYVGAGTVEFIVDEAAMEFYFLEVNTRLQVEHPVTESIAGVDLVQWQIRITQGETLSLRAGLSEGARSAISGHSIEARVVAEDPGRNFLPSIGKIVGWALPQGPGVRVDTGYGADRDVPQFYDSLLAKVIVHAETRASAIARLVGALQDFHVLGVKTNIGFLIDLLRSDGFQSGSIDTGYVERHFSTWHSPPPPDEIGLIESCARPATELASRRISEVWSQADEFRNVG